MAQNNQSLRKANATKNDEFYTRLGDIENELRHYKDRLRGKVIFCNCDDPRDSFFTKYFELNFEHLGIKKLITTHFETDKPSYKLELTGDRNKDGKVDSYDWKQTKLRQNGDFRSPECIELLKEADIVITNPPFSLFREYVAQLMEYNKRFLIIGNKNALTYQEIFKLIKDNKLWLGYTSASEFLLPDGHATKRIQGLTRWFTNLDTTNRHELVTLYKKYDADEYPKYDNFDAVNVNRVTDIPVDYDREMGVPITFIDKYNPDQFEIIDGLNRYALLDTQNTNEGVRARRSHTCNIDGKSTYFRIVVKNRQVAR